MTANLIFLALVSLAIGGSGGALPDATQEVSRIGNL